MTLEEMTALVVEVNSKLHERLTELSEAFTRIGLARDKAIAQHQGAIPSQAELTTFAEQFRKYTGTTATISYEITERGTVNATIRTVISSYRTEDYRLQFAADDRLQKFSAAIKDDIETRNYAQAAVKRLEDFKIRISYSNTQSLAYAALLLDPGISHKTLVQQLAVRQTSQCPLSLRPLVLDAMREIYDPFYNLTKRTLYVAVQEHISVALANGRLDPSEANTADDPQAEEDGKNVRGFYDLSETRSAD